MKSVYEQSSIVQSKRKVLYMMTLFTWNCVCNFHRKVGWVLISLNNRDRYYSESKQISDTTPSSMLIFKQRFYWLFSFDIFQQLSGALGLVFFIAIVCLVRSQCDLECWLTWWDIMLQDKIYYNPGSTESPWLCWSLHVFGCQFL